MTLTLVELVATIALPTLLCSGWAYVRGANVGYSRGRAHGVEAGKLLATLPYRSVNMEV